MLDKASKKLLKFIVKNNPNAENGLFTYDYVGNELSLSKEEMFDCIRFLEEQGLVRCVWIEPGGVKQLHGFAPNHKGRHHAEFARLEFYKSILESVLLPILVSILTTIILAA